MFLSTIVTNRDVLCETNGFDIIVLYISRESREIYRTLKANSLVPHPPPRRDTYTKEILWQRKKRKRTIHSNPTQEQSCYVCVWCTSHTLLSHSLNLCSSFEKRIRLLKLWSSLVLENTFRLQRNVNAALFSYTYASSLSLHATHNSMCVSLTSSSYRIECFCISSGLKNSDLSVVSV